MRTLLTNICGRLANLKIKWLKNLAIKLFIKYYKVNMCEALYENIGDYHTFNDFFIRKLKPTARPIAKSMLIAPVDGTIGEYGMIRKNVLIQAKNYRYTLEELLANKDCEHFINGEFLTIYLAPNNYHRVHMPIDATLKSMTYIKGSLFPVKPKYVNNTPKLFARNRRVVFTFDTKYGTMAIVMVGAMIVGKIGTSFAGDLDDSMHLKTQLLDISFKQGEELGYFKLGSTIVMLTNKNFPQHKNIDTISILGSALS